MTDTDTTEWQTKSNVPKRATISVFHGTVQVVVGGIQGAFAYFLLLTHGEKTVRNNNNIFSTKKLLLVYIRFLFFFFVV